MQKLWKLIMKIIPIVIGAQGTIPIMLYKHLEESESNIAISQMQATLLLSTAKILRKVMEV